MARKQNFAIEGKTPLIHRFYSTLYWDKLVDCDKWRLRLIAADLKPKRERRIKEEREEEVWILCACSVAYVTGVRDRVQWNLPPCATTSHKYERPLVQNTNFLSAKSLWSKPLVSRPPSVSDREDFQRW